MHDAAFERSDGKTISSSQDCDRSGERLAGTSGWTAASATQRTVPQRDANLPEANRELRTAEGRKPRQENVGGVARSLCRISHYAGYGYS